MAEELAPILAIIFIFGGTIAIVALALRFKARKLEHQEILKALEHGQELPMLEVRKKYNYLTDLRIGVFLIAAGLGTWLFLREIPGAYSSAAIGFIPALIGVGFVVMAFVIKNVAEKNGNGNNNKATG